MDLLLNDFRTELDSFKTVSFQPKNNNIRCMNFRFLPAGEFGGELGEEVAGPAAARLRQRGSVVREGGRGRRPVVGGRAAVPQRAAVEGAAAGRSPWETHAVRRGGVGNAVDGGHRVPLAAGRHGHAAVAGRRKGRRRVKVGSQKPQEDPLTQLVFLSLFTKLLLLFDFAVKFAGHCKLQRKTFTLFLPIRQL